MGIKIPKNNLEKFGWAHELMDWIDAAVFAAVGAILIFGFTVGLVRVDGPSMYPTLHDKDRVVIDRIFSEPGQGDIVVADIPDMEPIIKRVIAVEGQTVDIDFDAGTVYVDGEALVEPYVNEQTYLYEGIPFPVTVPEGCLFLMGDNRNHSMDSRSPEIGMVSREILMGKVLCRFWPLDRLSLFPEEPAFAGAA